MRVWDHVSASQIETFLLCERKWFFKSIMGLPTPEHASAKLGKDVHDSIERYLLGEIPATELHPLARRVYERGFMPDPEFHAGRYTVEQAIDGMTIEGVPVEGYIDLLEADEITDWKTRGDPVRYSKTAEQLTTDVQLAIYAKYALSRALSADAIRVRHVNIGTKPPNAVTESGPIELHREDVKRTFTRTIEPAVRRMREVALLPSPMRVTPNVRACHAFGGCPFRDKCDAADKVASISISPTQGATSMPESTANKGSIMARLRSDSAPATAPAANPNPVRPPDAPPSGAKAALLARLNTAKAADVTKPDAPAPSRAAEPAPATAGSASGADRKPRGFAEKLAALGYDEKQIARMAPATMHAAIDGKINARDVSISKTGELVKIERAPVAPKSDVPPPDLTDLDACVKYAGEALGWDSSDGGELDKMGDDMLVFVCDKKIARGTVDLVMGDDGKIADLEERTPAPAPSRPAVAETAPEPGPMIHAPASGLVLYIGCRPVKGPHVAAARPLADLVAELGALVAEDAKIEHYGLIEYNDGAKRIAALLTREPPKGVFVVDRGLATTPHALEALLPFADVVITAGV